MYCILEIYTYISALVPFCFSLEKKRAKVAEQLTPPIQEEPEPVSNVLQGDDILALAIKKEDLKKVRIKSRGPFLQEHFRVGRVV